MNPPLRHILAALTLGSLCFVLGIQAAGMKSETRVARLDQLVTLTDEQRAQAAGIFQAEDAAIEALPVPDRLMKGTEPRQKSRQQIRALLSPTQRNKYDLAPQTLGGGLRSNPDNMVHTLDGLLALSDEQKQRAGIILWSELADQLAAVPEGGELMGFRWREGTRDKLRAFLTPAQLQKYDSTPTSEGGAAKTGGVAPKAK